MSDSHQMIEEEKAAWDKFTDEIIKAGGIEEWHGHLQCIVCLGDVFGNRGKAANYTYWKIGCKNGDVRYCRNMPAEYIQKLGLSESLAKMYGRPLGYTRHEGYVTLEDMAKILEDEAGIKIKGYGG